MGDAVTFRCASSGQPEPSIQWSSAKGKQPKTDSGLMTFAAIDWKDSGTYVCTASNPYGALSAKVKLKVVKRKLFSFESPVRLISIFSEMNDVLLNVIKRKFFSISCWVKIGETKQITSDLSLC